METKEKNYANTGIENTPAGVEQNLLVDFYEGIMDGIIPQLELTIAAVLQNLSDNTVTQSQVQTETYVVKGRRIGKGVTLDIESLV